MKITGYESNAAVLGELAQRLRDQRLALGLTQAELAKKSGVSARTVARLESGESIALEGFLGVLRALGALRNIDLLVPEYRMLPTEVLDGKRKRKRAPSPKSAQANEMWAWGDER
ncbi:MAG: helix-turn-helix domain-containing protein [Gordonibacter sp.]|uniref:helix-turn-helix domain-containing protein n=1 Tax=Gordonibacter sp. TaxID=1968902 RepID=UPI002FCA32FC